MILFDIIIRQQSNLNMAEVREKFMSVFKN